MALNARLLVGLVLVLGLAIGRPTAAQAANTTLFSTMTAPISVTGVNSASATPDQWVAQQFVATTSGSAKFVSFWSQCSGGACPATATMELWTNSGGHPGTRLSSSSVSVDASLKGSPSCVALPTPPLLSAGTAYWAVMRSPGAPVTWNYQNNTAATVLASANQGASWSTYAGIAKTFGLKVEDGPGSSCGASVAANPAPGSKIQLLTSAGGVTYTTVFVGNGGNSDLSLTAGRFTGPDASKFQLLDGPPGPLAHPYRFPHSVPASATSTGAIMYVVCTGPSPGGTISTTLQVDSNDPDHPTTSWPVECRVNRAPTITATQSPDGGGSWWHSPATVALRGSDPDTTDSMSMECTDSAGPSSARPARRPIRGSAATAHTT
jgi:hypothetical protein